MSNEEILDYISTFRDDNIFAIAELLARGITVEQVHEIIPFSEQYRRVGCQFQPFNSIYQLYDDKINSRLDTATDMLMIPEYLLYRLCGGKVREYTNATSLLRR